MYLNCLCANLAYGLPELNKTYTLTYLSAFVIPAIAGTHLPTPEGWKAELAWMAGYVVRQFICPKAVTHPTSNRAQRRATALIETNALPLH